MSREALPNCRQSYNFTLTFQGEQYHVTIGHYVDGRPGEVFITRIYSKTSAKVGTQLDDVCRDSAILASLAIQHGADLKTIHHALTRDDDNEPTTIVGAIVDQLMKEEV